MKRRDKLIEFLEWNGIDYRVYCSPSHKYKCTYHNCIASDNRNPEHTVHNNFTCKYETATGFYDIILYSKIHCKISESHLTKVRIAVVSNNDLYDTLTNEDIALARRKHWKDYPRQ